MLEIKNLHKSYKGFTVLDGLYMTINKGDVYGFLGKNGSGKTTTMNIICNIIPKDEGEINIGQNGEKVKIGYLPESPALYSYMNGYEYLDYIASVAHYSSDRKARISEVLDITGMTEGGKRRIKGYSRGMNQRLGIAAAILDNPDLLILDEPTSALDPEGRAEVMSIIKNLADMGCTIILCTHILGDVERAANRVGIMKNGKLAAEGGIGEIVDRYRTDSVEIEFMNPEESIIELIRSADFSKEVQFYKNSETAVVSVENAEKGMIDAMRFLAEKNIAVRGIRTSRPTLEQVYLDIVGRGR